ncbi:hypothetical protein MKW92_035318 [Papaver armeniacum]|nr:hypothetical protein MKW92_035318 [Papaver armeniacum]
MSSGDLLKIQPAELKFPFELKKQITCSLQLTNKTDEYVAFKVQTSTPMKYCVRPNKGIILPGTTCDIIVTMQAQTKAPQDMQCKDEFFIQSVTAPNGATEKDITPEMFENESWKVVKEFKLRVIYVPANVPENGYQLTCLLDAVSDSQLKGHKMYFSEVKGDSVSFDHFEDMVKERLKCFGLKTDFGVEIYWDSDLIGCELDFFDMWRDVKPDQWGYVALTVEILGSSCDDMGLGVSNVSNLTLTLKSPPKKVILTLKSPPNKVVSKPKNRKSPRLLEKESKVSNDVTKST